MGRPVIKVVVLIASAIVTVAVFAVAPIAVYDRVTFGTFNVAGPPARIDYCGRRYYPGTGTLTMPQVQTELARIGEDGLTEVGRTVTGQPIVTHVMPESERARDHTNICTMVLYVRTGPDSYVPYGLSGGP